jgi:hypothetical protein
MALRDAGKFNVLAMDKATTFDNGITPKQEEKKMDKGHTVYKMPAAQNDEYQEVAWGVPKHGEKFEPMHINRAKVAPGMVKFKMLYCGICHTDMHSAHGDFGPGEYPRVPGHELLGQVVEVG